MQMQIIHCTLGKGLLLKFLGHMYLQINMLALAERLWLDLSEVVHVWNFWFYLARRPLFRHELLRLLGLRRAELRDAWVSTTPNANGAHELLGMLAMTGKTTTNGLGHASTASTNTINNVMLGLGREQKHIGGRSRLTVAAAIYRAHATLAPFVAQHTRDIDC